MILILCALIAASPLQAADDDDFFKRIVKEQTHDRSGVSPLCAEFLKKYPRSGHVPSVRLIQADAESNPAAALALFRSIVRWYPRFDKRDYAQLRICEIHHLQADWNALKIDSQYGMETFPRSVYLADFRFFYIAAALKMYRYDIAGDTARALTEGTHRYETLAKTLLIQASLNRKQDGYSRGYIYTLRELLLGYKDSAVHPSILFLLGDFYDHTGDAGRALTAYEDLEKLYPRSPEAELARVRLKELKDSGTVRVPYYPDEKTIAGTDSIDISPDMAVQENEDGAAFFAVSIGPFQSVSQTSEIKKLLKGFEPVSTVRLREGFIHYVGKSPTLEKALGVKIRLAEELGINGNIVRVSGKNGSLYIYGE